MDSHEVTSGQLYSWRRQAMSGELSGKPVAAQAVPVFAEVRIADPGPAVPALPPPVPVELLGRIGIELPSGIRLTGRDRPRACPRT